MLETRVAHAIRYGISKTATCMQDGQAEGCRELRIIRSVACVIARPKVWVRVEWSGLLTGATAYRLSFYRPSRGLNRLLVQISRERAGTAAKTITGSQN
jgi:hypothetical protein